jgi:hypothetical protein
MIVLFVSALALFAADHHGGVDSGCGYSTEGAIEEQFDRCMAGEWGFEYACTMTGTVTHEGFTGPHGEFCPIDYLIRDPHTGGFRVGFQCPGGERVVTVLIVEDDVVRTSDGHAPAAWQCSAPE